MWIILTANRYPLDPALIEVDLWQFQGALDDARNADTDQDRLRRELDEEACATVAGATLLGFTRGQCVAGPERGLVLVRSVWRADVELRLREARFEIARRRVVAPAAVKDALSLDSHPFGRGVISAAEGRGAERWLRELLELIEARRLLRWLGDLAPFGPCQPPLARPMLRGSVPGHPAAGHPPDLVTGTVREPSVVTAAAIERGIVP